MKVGLTDEGVAALAKQLERLIEIFKPIPIPDGERRTAVYEAKDGNFYDMIALIGYALEVVEFANDQEDDDE